MGADCETGATCAQGHDDVAYLKGDMGKDEYQSRQNARAVGTAVGAVGAVAGVAALEAGGAVAATGAGAEGAGGQVVARVVANRIAGNAFRDQIAAGMENLGYQVRTEVYKWTIFGARYIDIEVAKAGVVLGGIETKFGSSSYTAAQQAKDAWLNLIQGYVVNVVRDH
jgi:hypothetical protein